MRLYLIHERVSQLSVKTLKSLKILMTFEGMPTSIKGPPALQII